MRYFLYNFQTKSKSHSEEWRAWQGQKKANKEKTTIEKPVCFVYRMIASSVRRISRSFYSASNETLNTSHHRTGSFAEISGVTRQSVVARKIAQQRFNQTSQSDSDLPELEKKVVEPIVTTPPSSSPSTSSCQEPSQTPVSKKLSRINLRKLKIW